MNILLSLLLFIGITLTNDIPNENIPLVQPTPKHMTMSATYKPNSLYLSPEHGIYIF